MVFVAKNKSRVFKLKLKLWEKQHLSFCVQKLRNEQIICKDTLQAQEGGIDKGELLIADFIFPSMSVFRIFTQLEATFFK